MDFYFSKSERLLPGTAGLPRFWLSKTMILDGLKPSCY